MGKGRSDQKKTHSELKWRADAGTATDYKEVGTTSTSCWTEEMDDSERRIRDDSFFYRDDDEDEEQENDERNLLSRRRIPWNDRQRLVAPTPRSKMTRQRGSGKWCGMTSPQLWMSLSISFLATTLILLTSNVGLVSSCNEAVCASIVSKCTLTQACRCALSNCSCCKECFDCLTYLYDECCSCVELCPKPNISHHIIMHSQVGDLKEPIDDLFRALTDEKDIQGRWATFTYPIDIDQSWFMPKPEQASSANVYTVGKIVVDPSKEVVTVNCTVAYMSECMPLNKCQNSCHSMGASHFRWFHDGCCECIGSTCINYGIDESRCTRCTMEDDAEDDPLETDAPKDTDNDTGIRDT